MQTEAGRRRFTVDEYYRMAGIGILKDGERTELIDGEVLEMSPMGFRHSAAVKRADALFNRVFQGKAIVSVQLPVRLDAFNEPQPDVGVLRPRRDFYESGHPGPEDTLLVLEISDTSFRYDHEVKLGIYAAAQIPEFWILDLADETLLVFREPSRRIYETTISFRRGDSVSPVAFPEIVIAISDLLASE
jgi:Uma2 family endonuclease